MATIATTSKSRYGRDDQERKFKEIMRELVSKQNDPNFIRYVMDQEGYDLSVVDEELGKLQGFGIGQQEQKPEMISGEAQVTSGTAQELGDSKAASKMLESLEQAIKENQDILGPVEGRARSLNPYDERAQTFQSQVNATKQIVGKYLEGGVLRLEDEKKYERILPKLGDTPEVAKNKLAEVRRLIENKYSSQIETLGKSGFDIANLAPQEQTTQPSQDQMALEWAKANPDDPRAAQVMAKLNQSPAQSPTEEDVSPTAQTSQEDGAFMGLAKDLGERATNIYENVKEAQDSKGRSFFENMLRSQEANIRNIGQVAGAVGDVGVRALQLVYQSVTNEDQRETIEQKANEFMETEAGQTAVSALQAGVKEWDEFKESNPNAAKDLEAVGNILTALPAGKGLGMAGKEAKALTGDALEVASRTLGKDVITKAGDDIFRAVKPTVTVKRSKDRVKNAMNSANAEIISRGLKPTNLQEYSEAISSVKKQVWSEVEKAIGNSEGLSINLKPLAEDLMRVAASPNLARVDSGAASKIRKMAESLISQGEQVSVPDAEAIKQMINAELKGAFGKFTTSNAEQNAKKLITQTIGKQMDDVLSNVPGEFQTLKNKYGALREIEEDVSKRLIVFGRQNPQSLVESFSKISGIGNVLKGIVTASPADIVKGTGEIVLGRMSKMANDADLIVKNAFENIAKRANDFEPRSTLLKKLTKIRPGMNVQDITQSPEVMDTIKKMGYQDSAASFNDAFNEISPLLGAKLGDEGLKKLFKKAPSLIWGNVTRR